MNVTVTGQLRPTTTTATTLVRGRASVSYIAVTNVGSQSETFRIFHSVKRTTPLYDETTAIHWDIPVGSQETVFVEFPLPIQLTSQHAYIGVRTSTASNLNFTAYGAA